MSATIYCIVVPLLFSGVIYVISVPSISPRSQKGSLIDRNVDFMKVILPDLPPDSVKTTYDIKKDVYTVERFAEE